jgi:hypothetical protein
MTTESLKAALELAQERDRLQAQIAKIETEIQAQLNGKAETLMHLTLHPGDITTEPIVKLLRIKGEANLSELANAAKTTRGSIYQWTRKHSNIVQKVRRGIYALK